MAGTTIIDIAGASMGGAKKLYDELQCHLRSRPSMPVRLVGEGVRLSARHLATRERSARDASIAISLNNASFVAPGAERIVMLHNALHFASSEEVRTAGTSRGLRIQIPIIRALALHANRIIVPCTGMAERVERHLPQVTDRIVTRLQPVSPPSWTGTTPTAPRTVLLPSLPAPYKKLDERARHFLDATEGTDITLRVTAQPGQLGDIEHHPRQPTGHLTHDQLAHHWAQSTAIYFPTTIESFGYPLAEARCGGRSVIAVDTPQNREIAGPALHPFTPEHPDTLTHAIHTALDHHPTPDTTPFDPTTYFEKLFDARSTDALT